MFKVQQRLLTLNSLQLVFPKLQRSTELLVESVACIPRKHE